MPIRIDPYHIATMGVTGKPITISTDGFIVLIEEEIITSGGAIDVAPHNPWEKKEPKKKKRITAIVTIRGHEYRESIEVDDLSITAKDIHVKVSDAEKPTIKLTVMRGYHDVPRISKE